MGYGHGLKPRRSLKGSDAPLVPQGRESRCDVAWTRGDRGGGQNTGHDMVAVI
jgi:hypothetical protein